MANSTTNIDTIVQSQASKEVTANAFFDATSQAALYGRRSSTCTGLVFGFYGGNMTVAAGTLAAIANGTLSMTANTTNYIVASKSTGALSVSTATTNWNDTVNYWRIYSVVAGASTVTSYTDYRENGKYSVNGPNGPSSIVANSAGNAFTITQTGAGNAFVVEDATSTDSTSFVIDTNGNLILGDTAVRAFASGTPKQQVAGIGSNALLGLHAYTADAVATIFEFAKSRQATLGHTIVQANDELAALRFSGSDGAAFARAAGISVFVDGTPGSNDMPGRLVFSTSPDGSATPVERLRIDSLGGISLNKTITAGGTTGAQTIDKPTGSVNFAAAATTLVVTNAIVTANSLIVATVGTDDATMKSVKAIAAAGSFTLIADAAATAETRVNFIVLS